MTSMDYWPLILQTGLLCGAAIALAGIGGCASHRSVEKARSELLEQKKAELAARDRRRTVEALTRTREDRRFEPVYFDYGKSEVRADQQPILRQHAEKLRANPGFRLLLEGHTDLRGPDQFNQELARKRAESVRQFLIQAGVAAQQLTVANYGKQRPLTREQTETAQARNRRIEFVILEPQANMP